MNKTNQDRYIIVCKCKNCQNDFYSSIYNKAFCSDNCEYEFRSQKHINKGKCLNCQKELSLKQLKKGTKFCDHSCSTIYNNSIRTEEDNERIRKICRESQLKIMSDKDEVRRRIKKKKETMDNWTYEQKQQLKEKLSKNTKRQLEKETPEQKEKRIQKSKDTFNKKSLEELQMIKDKIRKTKDDWSEEKRREIQNRKNKSRRTTLLLSLDHIEDFNKEFINRVFIKDKKFLFYEFRDYFNLAKTTAYHFKELLGITYQNKQKLSKPQQEIFDFLSIDISKKRLNDRTLIKPQEIDILITDARLAIEYDGLMYHSKGISKNSMFNNPDFDIDYHLNKTELVEEKGYQLFYIFESDDIDIWKSMINNKLGLNKKIYARKCQMREVKNDFEKRDFLERNHLQGYCVSSINYGLFYDNELVSLMTFGKSRFNKNYDWELLRFCTKCGYNVVGGASKLLSHFRKHNQGSIISYANRRWSNGNLYRKIGFKEIGKTAPNYFYFKEDERILYSRNKFQKHKLKDMLENFNPELSETQNMFNNGYRQIFDCGNFVFVLE